MQIYKYEKEAGLEDVVSKSGRISFCSAISAIEPKEDELKKLLVTAKLNNLSYSEQIDKGLFFLSSILLSTGWNLNDDVFERQEAWISRHTGDNKPFNYMHTGHDIIGHSLSSYVIDEEHNVISDSPIENPTDFNDVPFDLPEKFHLVENSVLYKFWEDPALQERMNTLIDEIKQDKWFVSVEALFTNFDYALITPNHEHKIIARCDETSFLTKHLRIYGGNGVYDNYRVGRVLRNMTFCGKGLVSKPANPNSVILSTNSFKGELVKSSEIFDMADDNKVAALEAQVAELTKHNAELIATKNDEVVNTLKAEIKESQTKLAETEKAIESLKTAAAANETLVSELKAQLEKITAEKAEKDKEIDKMKKEKKSSSRYSLLVEAGKTDAEAKELVEKFDILNDEQFADFVKYVGTAKSETVVETVVETETEINEDSNEGQANASVIDTAVAETDTGSLGNTLETDKDLIVQMSALLSKNCRFPLKDKGEN